jgi:hypothetical protein
MDLYPIAEVKECCHAPLASFNARFAEQLQQPAGIHRLDGPSPNVSYCAGFRTPAVTTPPHVRAAGV